MIICFQIDLTILNCYFENSKQTILDMYQRLSRPLNPNTTVHETDLNVLYLKITMAPV